MVFLLDMFLWSICLGQSQSPPGSECTFFSISMHPHICIRISPENAAELSGECEEVNYKGTALI